GRDTRENAEGHARIHDEHEMKKTPDDDDGARSIEAPQRPTLRQLIRHEDCRGEHEHQDHQAALWRMIGAQRSQSAGCSRSCPTPTLHVQHRAPFRPAARCTSTAKPGSAVARATTRSVPVARPAGGGPDVTSSWETMKSSFKGRTPTSASRRSSS